MSYIPAAVIKDGGATTENIRADRSANQSPIDNTKDGIVNLSSDTGAGIGCRANYAAILGGDLNEIQDANGLYCVIAGGSENQICLTGTDYSWCTIGGGWQNLIGSTTQGAFNTIAGGALNKIGQAAVDSIHSTIGGGRENKIEGENATIAGGNTNAIYADATVESAGFIGGGAGNFIGVGAGASLVYNSIVGGLDNLIGNGAGITAAYGVIGGGNANHIADAFAASYALIGGGQGNLLQNADYGAILGGLNNSIGYTAGNPVCIGGFIGGGQNNELGSKFGSIPGGDAAQTIRYGQQSWAAGYWPTSISGSGNRQRAKYIVFGTDTTGGGVSLLDEDGNPLNLEDGRTYAVRATCLAVRYGASGRSMFINTLLVHADGGTAVIDNDDITLVVLNGETYSIAYSAAGADIIATFTGTAGHNVRAVVSYEWLESTSDVP